MRQQKNEKSWRSRERVQPEDQTGVKRLDGKKKRKRLDTKDIDFQPSKVRSQPRRCSELIKLHGLRVKG